MNKKLTALLAAGLIAACTMSVSAADDSIHTISVTGDAKISVPADMATFYVRVNTRGADAKEASVQNAQIMNRVRSAVIAAGADVSKLETSNYSVSPEYKYDKNGRSSVTQYTATNSMKVVVNNIKIAGTVMDAAVDAGATSVDSITFGLKDEDAYKDKVLRMATQDAYHKANVMANAVGKSIIGTVSLSQNQVYVQPRYAMGAVKLAAADNSVRPETSVEGGNEDLESSVSAVFQIN